MPPVLDHVAVLPRGQNTRFTIELGNRLPDEGIMRVRVRASRVKADDASIPSLQLLFGWQASNEGRAVLPVPDAERAITAHARRTRVLSMGRAARRDLSAQLSAENFTDGRDAESVGVYPVGELFGVAGADPDRFRGSCGPGLR